ncbi:hypothetical protein DM02DRAFT_631180 [Periconia macrospinosa]|uniref:Uncharacterized protein n=1 Tax=Periconia macrospinosa TaxID=97972 RepID=A0A2V1DGT8_9PLEO|nr:hypothetical protein DM02DRAFT_631180 [Periconia macrospinosa]
MSTIPLRLKTAATNTKDRQEYSKNRISDFAYKPKASTQLITKRGMPLREDVAACEALKSLRSCVMSAPYNLTEEWKRTIDELHNRFTDHLLPRTDRENNGNFATAGSDGHVESRAKDVEQENKANIGAESWEFIAHDDVQSEDSEFVLLGYGDAGQEIPEGVGSARCEVAFGCRRASAKEQKEERDTYEKAKARCVILERRARWPLFALFGNDWHLEGSFDRLRVAFQDRLFVTLFQKLKVQHKKGYYTR